MKIEKISKWFTSLRRKKFYTKQKSVEEIENEEKEDLFKIYEALQKCKNMDCLKENFLEITKIKNKISPEQYKNLASLKDDMKISLEKIRKNWN